MSDAWPVRCQTYGYLPSHLASPPIGWYQIILLGDRGTSVLISHVANFKPAVHAILYQCIMPLIWCVVLSLNRNQILHQLQLHADYMICAKISCNMTNKLLVDSLAHNTILSESSALTVKWLSYFTVSTVIVVYKHAMQAEHNTVLPILSDCPLPSTMSKQMVTSTHFWHSGRGVNLVFFYSHYCYKIPRRTPSQEC